MCGDGHSHVVSVVFGDGHMDMLFQWCMAVRCVVMATVVLFQWCVVYGDGHMVMLFQWCGAVRCVMITTWSCCLSGVGQCSVW